MRSQPATSSSPISPIRLAKQVRSVVRFIAAQPDGIATTALLADQGFAEIDSVISLLLRRDLIEEMAGAYQLQVEFIRRWFARERR